MKLGKFSMGIGDRFAHQGQAQLAAFTRAKELGVEITPVWNKSNREHQIIHTLPSSVRQEADAAVRATGWKGAYHVDADHIGLKTVDGFLASSDFFTLDVADFIGKPAADADIQAFVSQFGQYVGQLRIPGIEEPFQITPATLQAIARKYLFAVQKAGRIYRHIETAKGLDQFITEISMDETDQPQTPLEMLFILAAIAAQKIPGRFNKGVDYVGNVRQFEIVARRDTRNQQPSSLPL